MRARPATVTTRHGAVGREVHGGRRGDHGQVRNARQLEGPRRPSAPRHRHEGSEPSPKRINGSERPSSWLQDECRAADGLLPGPESSSDGNQSSAQRLEARPQRERG